MTFVRGAALNSLIEVYNLIYHFDLFAVSESMLSSEIKNDISVEGVSKDIYRSDHPSNFRIGVSVFTFVKN